MGLALHEPHLLYVLDKTALGALAIHSELREILPVKMSCKKYLTPSSKPICGTPRLYMPKNKAICIAERNRTTLGEIEICPVLESRGLFIKRGTRSF